jgi:hypothetical protein
VGLANTRLLELNGDVMEALAWSGGKVRAREVELSVRHQWRGGGELGGGAAVRSRARAGDHSFYNRLLALAAKQTHGQGGLATVGDTGV